MTIETNPAPARFTAGAAIGYAWVIFRTRPVSFVRLALIQAVVFALIGFASFALMGWAGRSAALPVEEQMAAVLRAGAAVSTLNLVMLVVIVWLEAAWLDVFLNRRLRFWPGWGPYGRLLLSFVIAFAVFMGGYLAIVFVGLLLALLAGAAAGVLAGALVGVAAVAGFFAFLIFVQMRFTALPALVHSGRGLPVGRALGLARGRLGALFLSWLAYAGLYVVVTAAAFAIFTLMPGGPWRSLQAALAEPDNPLAQYAAYTPLIESAGAAALGFAALVVMNLLFTPLTALSRGIGVRLALEAESS
ncbi:MAG: hypothetical protein ACFE0P_16260 [Oceanicaulis sp.]